MSDEVAEWLRRWTANPLCSARVGSNPILVESFFTTFFWLCMELLDFLVKFQAEIIDFFCKIDKFQAEIV